MNYTEDFFLKAISAFVNGKTEEYDLSKVNTGELYSLAKRHSMQGLFCYVCDIYNVFPKDSDFYQKIHKDYEKAVSFMSLRHTRAELLSDAFSKMGIQHIEFKGSAVARYYDVPELRVFSDVDMIIKEEDRDAVRRYMEEKEFEYYISDGGIVSCFKKGYEFYEIHTALNLPESEEFLSRNVWEHTYVYKDKALRFEDNFHLSYLISHIEKHIKSGGAGVKMYLDVALYIKNCEKIDLLKVREILEKAGLHSFFDTVLYLCNKWFDTPLPSFAVPLSEDAFERLEYLTLSGGVYGDKSGESNLESALIRQISAGKKGAKLRLFMSHVFPSKTELWRVYPKYEGKNVLVPVAWCNHVFNTVRKGKLKKVKAITNMDVKSAQNRKDFLTDIGCK